MDLPKSVMIFEEGPREGFQIEKGPISTDDKVRLIDALSDIGVKHIQVGSFVDPRRVPGLADTMAWATPDAVRRVVGVMKERFPQLEIKLHLHDTRGLGLANAYAGLLMGVRIFDSKVAGLGGCPFAKHKGAAGNICTEDFVLMCEEMGIDTGIDLEAMIAAANLAEQIVGHAVPSHSARAGSLSEIRARVRAAA